MRELTSRGGVRRISRGMDRNPHSGGLRTTAGHITKVLYSGRIPYGVLDTARLAKLARLDVSSFLLGAAKITLKLA